MPRLFAYATLQRSGPDHHCLNRQARLLGHHCTPGRYTLVDHPNMPIMVFHGSMSIEGEVFALSDTGLAHLEHQLVNRMPALERRCLPTPYGDAWVFGLARMPAEATPLPCGNWLLARRR